MRTAPRQVSDLLGFSSVKMGSQNGTYEADIAKDKIDLKPGMGDDGDVYYKYQNEGGGAQRQYHRNRNPAYSPPPRMRRATPTASGWS